MKIERGFGDETIFRNWNEVEGYCLNNFKKKYNIANSSEQEIIQGSVKRFIKNLKEYFENPAKLKGKKILDIGCGATSRTMETCSYNYLVNSYQNKKQKELTIAYSRMYEPWFPRIVTLLGAECVAIDQGENIDKEYTFIKTNLYNNIDVLEGFKKGDFDIIHMELFLNSPSQPFNKFYEKNNPTKIDLAFQIKRQVERILPEDGIEMINWEDGSGLSEEEHRVFLEKLKK